MKKPLLTIGLFMVISLVSCQKETLQQNAGTEKATTGTSSEKLSATNSTEKAADVTVPPSISLTPGKDRIPTFTTNGSLPGCRIGPGQCIEVTIHPRLFALVSDAVNNGTIRNILSPQLIAVLSNGDLGLTKLLAEVQLGLKKMVAVPTGDRTTFVIGTTDNMPVTKFEGAIVLGNE